MTRLGRPVICFVSDRRRIGDGSDDALIERIAAAADAGATLIQLRERGLDDRHLAALTERAVAAAGDRAAVVVNDRVDVALASGAAGVHLRADSIDASRVRAIVPPGFLVGRSVHGAEEARQAAASGVDYLIAGTVYPSASKPAGSAVLGLPAFAEIVRAVGLPVLAIGGIAADNLQDVAATGAAGVAAIGLFTDAAADALADAVAGIRRAFEQGSGAERSSHV